MKLMMYRVLGLVYLSENISFIRFEWIEFLKRESGKTSFRPM
jgi:hypothetical protein